MKTVQPRGPEDSPFVIVGEAPGSKEIIQGLPFVGPSGQVLEAALSQFPKDSYPEPRILNVVPHLIPSSKKNQDVLAELTEQYRPQLLEEIKKHPRKIILALGNAALWALTGNNGLKITKCRGKRYDAPELAENGIIASVHPAFLLRGNGSLRQFKADVAHAVDIAGGAKPRSFKTPTYEVIDNVYKMGHFIKQVKEHEGIIAGDLETSGFWHRHHHILCGGFSLDGDHVYVIPGIKSDVPARQNFIADLSPIWDRNLPIKFSWHNGKFDIKFLRWLGQDARVDHDTMLMSYALDEQRGLHDLETVAGDWLNSPNWKGVIEQHLPKKGASYDHIPWDVLIKYMAYDIANTFRLTELLGHMVEIDGYSNLLYYRTLIPASNYLTDVEEAGMRVDPGRVEENRQAYQTEADQYREAINQQAIADGWGPINPNSPLQLADYFYNTLRLPTKEKGTSDKILEKLPDHPAVINLRKYRKINKGLSTYVKPVMEKCQGDGRVHQTYLIHGTPTGRLACRDPNLQNIPREPKLRGQFVPEDGYVFIEVDLNQAELRSLAALSKDPELCRIYTDPNSVGLHEEVRRDLYGNPEDWSPQQLEAFFAKWYTDEVSRVKEEQKMRAKNVNFGIVYGITPFGLSAQIEDSVGEATRMLKGWAKKFSAAWEFIEKCREAPLRGQNLVTPFGYRKRFQIVTRETLGAIQNEAANFPHQSIATTITMHGGIRVNPTLRREWNARIVNTVHDSVIVECPANIASILEVSKYVIKEMEQVPVDWGITQIPFKAEAKVGLRWGYMKDLDEWLETEDAKQLPAAMAA